MVKKRTTGAGPIDTSSAVKATAAAAVQGNDNDGDGSDQRHHDLALFRQALAACLPRHCSSTRADGLRTGGKVFDAYGDADDVELLDDAVDHVCLDLAADTLDALLGQAKSAATVGTDAGGLYDGTLSSIDGHPLSAAISDAALEILALDSVDPALVLSETLDDYIDLLAAQAADDGIDGQAGSYGRESKKGELGECQLCERRMMLTAHHLIPRETHDLLLKRGVYTKKEMQTRIAWLCRPCHTAVHNHIPTSVLAADYNTVEKLLQHEGVYKWARYASRLKEKDRAFKGTGLREKR
ncbi:uncharacterized protein PFL1_05793 [Pseudozyma flocculosa PF-1]|uniref:HNH domain-containing protein n=2 Tax=Pseudozyma flocculosa TaxID=84751 RepID=A0A5C3F8Q7_9BASI|nr:uncharacterized protein PFL1_05793 [Pseudozyma flocculosa PF-1]EPQ26815.1 hypothetical protein PFL1_05793 [Pseudozyma flocculosa PF-1]SPO40853.1 uncharacterized protein PSFLO_06335 [Pseudozyma flocculosa]